MEGLVDGPRRALNFAGDSEGHAAPPVKQFCASGPGDGLNQRPMGWDSELAALAAATEVVEGGGATD